MNLDVTHRGKPLHLPHPLPSTLRDLRGQVASALSVPAQNVRLLSKGRILSHENDDASLEALLEPNQRVVAIASAPETISDIKAAKPDPLLRPFEPTAPKYVAAPRRTAQKPTEYGFGRVVALPNLPDSAHAQQILEQLASDRGFLSVMAKKRWRVGELREMPPEGRVGVDPVCVLGYNTNKGQQIHLRLRTDDMTGFRAMYTIRQVLAHELAHNEFSDHDNDFKELMRWIERTANRDDWRSRGSRLDDTWRAPDFGNSALSAPPATMPSGGTLGGSCDHSRLLDEAEARISEASQDSPPMQIEHNTELTSESEIAGSTACASEKVMLTEQTSTKTDKSEDHTKGTNTFSSTTPVATRHSPEKRPRSAPKSPTQPEPSSEATAPLTELMSLGFSRRLATLALRENGRDSSRAADWLLSQRQTVAPASEMGDQEVETTVPVRNAISSLRGSLNREQLIGALDTLHLYMSNLLRNPGVDRYANINDANSAFRKRVGAFEDALDVLRTVGFRLETGFWRYKSLNMSPVWIAKSIVQDCLLEELRRD